MGNWRHFSCSWNRAHNVMFATEKKIKKKDITLEQFFAVFLCNRVYADHGDDFAIYYDAMESCRDAFTIKVKKRGPDNEVSP